MKLLLIISLLLLPVLSKSQDSLLSVQYLQRGIQLLRENKPASQALKLFHKSTEADSNNAEAFYQKGNLIIDIGDEICYFDPYSFKEGIEYLEKALEKGFREAKVYTSLAQTKYRLEGKSSEKQCIQLLEKALIQEPSNRLAAILLIQYSEETAYSNKAALGYQVLLNFIDNMEPDDIDHLESYEINWLHRALSFKAE